MPKETPRNAEYLVDTNQTRSPCCAPYPNTARAPNRN